MAELPDIDGGFESDKIRQEFINAIYGNKATSDFFNQDLRGTNATIGALQGFLGNENVPKEIQEAAAGTLNVLNQRRNVLSENKDDNILDRTLKSVNQNIFGGVGTGIDAIVNTVMPGRDSNVRGGLLDTTKKLGMTYGDVDERALPTTYANRTGQVVAETLPFMFGGASVINALARPIAALPSAFGGSAIYQQGRNVAGRAVDDIASFIGRNPGKALTGEAASLAGYSAAVPYSLDVLEDEDASTVKKLAAGTLPLITGVAAPLATEGVKGTVKGTYNLTKKAGDNTFGRLIDGTRNVFYGRQNIDPTTGEVPGSWKLFKEGLKGNFNYETDKVTGGISTTIENNVIKPIVGFYDDTVNYLKTSETYKNKRFLELSKNNKYVEKQKKLAEEGKNQEEINLIIRKDIEEEVALEQAQAAERVAASNLAKAIKAGNGDPEKTLEKIAQYNADKAALDKDLGIELTNPSLASVAADDDPILMALTNFEMKSNEAFLKRTKSIVETYRETVQNRVNALGGNATPQQLTSVIQQARAETTDRIVKELQTKVSQQKERLVKNFGLDDEEASKRAGDILRTVYNDVKATEKRLWEGLKANYKTETTDPFTKTRNSLLRMVEGDLENINLPKDIKKRILQIQKLNEEDGLINFGEVDKLRMSINGAIRSLQNSNGEIDRNLLDNLIVLRSSFNEDIGDIFPFARNAAATTRAKHDIFTRNNNVYDMVSKNNRGVLQRNSAQSAESIFERNQLDGVPYALPEFKQAYLEGSKLSGKSANEIRAVVQESELAMQTILAQMSRDVIDENGIFQPNRFYTWMKDNKNLVNEFPVLKTVLKRYRNDIRQLEKDLNDDVFGQFTAIKNLGDGTFTLTTDTEKALLGQILDVDNPVPAIETMILNRATGSTDLMNIVKGVKALPKGQREVAEEGLKTSIIEAIIRSSVKEVTEDGVQSVAGKVVVRSNLTNALEETIGNKTLYELLGDTGLYSSSELRNLKKTLKIYDKDLQSFTNPEMFRLLQDVDPTSGMIDTFARVAAANFSTNFSTGAGAGLVIAGRFTRLAQAMLKNLKSDKARELIQDALLDSRKMERLLRIEQDINNPELTKKGLANSYVKFKSLLGQYGAELSFNDYKTAWEEMEAQDRFDLSVEDFNNLIKELEGDLK
tara:strand:+ start:1544 stop:5002 length:3459 start_codon:yes stop_codon:yes gene_type:complete